MATRGYLIVSGIFFFLVASLHLIRLILHTTVQIGDWLAPLWLSVGGFAVPISLSFFAFRLLGSIKKG
jgi:hypothetical protein